jgi:hypothetical protein
LFGSHVMILQIISYLVLNEIIKHWYNLGTRFTWMYKVPRKLAQCRFILQSQYVHSHNFILK